MTVDSFLSGNFMEEDEGDEIDDQDVSSPYFI